MRGFIVRLLREENGQDTIEYGLLAAFISIFCIVVIKAIGPLIEPIYETIETALTP